MISKLTVECKSHQKLTFMKLYYKYSRSQLWEMLSVPFCEGIKKYIFWCFCSWNSTSVVSKMFLNQSSFTLDNLTNNRLTELFWFLWHVNQTGSLSPLLAQLVLLPLVTFTAYNRPALLSTRPSSLLTDLIKKKKKKKNLLQAPWTEPVITPVLFTHCERWIEGN